MEHYIWLLMALSMLTCISLTAFCVVLRKYLKLRKKGESFGIKMYPARLIETNWELDWTEKLMQSNQRIQVRKKSAQSPIDWKNVASLVTYNSSVAIEAIKRGIPVISDKTNSAVGSFQDVVGQIHLDTSRRDSLLRWLSAHQMSLCDIERGRAWEVIHHYLPYSSAQIQEK